MDVGKKGSKESLKVLRAKYHDYCSAQVADLLVYMSPDEIYLLAHRAVSYTHLTLPTPPYV